MRPNELRELMVELIPSEAEGSMYYMPDLASNQIVSFRFHARGGQGAKTAAQLFAETALLHGFQIQAFPEYGPERRGAPVTTYVRLCQEPILLHCSVKDPDYIVVIDATLACHKPVIEGITEKTKVLINTKKSPDEVRQTLCVAKTQKLYLLDASVVAEHFLGKNLPNTAMIGALMSISGIGALPNLKKAMLDLFGKKWGEALVEKNYLAAKKGGDEVGGRAR